MQPRPPYYADAEPQQTLPFRPAYDSRLQQPQYQQTQQYEQRPWGPSAYPQHPSMNTQPYPAYAYNETPVPPSSQATYVEEPPPQYGEIYPPTEQPSSSRQPAEKARLNSYDDKYPLTAQSSSSSQQPVEKARSTSSEGDEKAEDEELLNKALEFTRNPVPQGFSAHALSKPIAVPQSSRRPGSPYSRAYAPILAEHGVSMQEFVEFIDNFNLVIASNPALDVLGLASNFLSMVPMANAQLLSLGVGVGIGIGNAAIMATRGALFMKKANADFFAPRGLKVETVSNKNFRSKINMPANRPLVAPMNESQDLTSLERVMAGLQGYVEPITFDVPEPNEPSNVLKKISAKQQARALAKAEKKNQKERQKYIDEYGGGSDPNYVSKDARKAQSNLNKIERERQKLERKRDKEVAKAERKETGSKLTKEVAKANKDFDKDMRKLDKEERKEQKELDTETARAEGSGAVKDKEDKEGGQAEKIRWIVVTSL